MRPKQDRSPRPALRRRVGLAAFAVWIGLASWPGLAPSVDAQVRGLVSGPGQTAFPIVGAHRE